MNPSPGEGALAAGGLVGHYKIVRLVGRGGSGEVYLARDTHLGRRVALKLVHLPQEDAGAGAGRQQTLDDFLSEARITAKFSHPHIVTVFGVGQHLGHPYVAFEYLEGQSLRQRLREERPGLKEAARIGLAVAEALAEAHRNQILHRDLKPENVMLPADGRLRVVDFGLATAQASRSSSVPPVPPFGGDGSDSTRRGASPSSGTTQIVGTPRYIAPEVWQEQSFSTASDIWALGMIIHELFCGRHPYASLSRLQIYQQVCSDSPVPAMHDSAELPAELVKLARRCVDKDPKCRASAREVADGLRRFLSLSRPPLPEEASPFRGLLPFTEHHADMFFGRDDEIGAFMERLRVTPVLPVVGPSGAGKSSFVQAGVLPRLRDRGHWITLLLRPGKDPFHALAVALHEAGGFLEETTVPRNPLEFVNEIEAMEALASRTANSSFHTLLARQLRESPGRLSLSLQQIADTNRGRVLLIVDQLEELYTLVEDAEIRQRLMQAICTASDDEQTPVRVIFTLRDDFIGRLAATAEAREALSHVTVLSSPGPEALRQILTKPLERVGYRYDSDDLIERMIRAIQGEMAGLPVLQFALSQLWERRDRDRRVLTTRAYDEMGGVEGALAGHADGIIDRLTPAQVRLAREIFLGLVTAQGTRRIVSRQALLEDLDPEAQEVLDILTRERAVLVRRAQDDREIEAELELVHESLIRNWRRLARWLEEGREEIAFLAEIGQAAELWEKRGRSNHEVWRGTTLQEAEIKITRCQVVPQLVQAFMNASRRLARRRVRRRRIAVAIAMIALAVVGIVFAVKEREVRQQREVAETQWERAESREAAAQREGALAALVRGNPLEARAKLRRSLETRDSTLARILWWRLSANPLYWQHQLGATIYQASYSPAGTSVAVSCTDGSIYLFDLQAKSTRILRGHEDHVISVAFSPDGQRLAAGTYSGDAWLWNLRQNKAKLLEGHSDAVWAMAISPDGNLIASGGADKTVRLWGGTTGKDNGRLLQLDKAVMAVEFSPEGKLLAVADFGNKLRLFDVADWREVRTFEGHEGRVMSVRFTPDGKSLVTSSRDTTVRVWDVDSGAQLRVLRGHTAPVERVTVDAAGEMIASGGTDKTIRIWDRSTGEQLGEIRSDTARVTGLAFGPDERWLVSSRLDSTVQLWDLRKPLVADASRGHKSGVYRVSFSPDGKLLASGSRDATIRIWNVETGVEQAVLRGHQGPIFAMIFNPDGTILASGGEDQSIILWNPVTGERIGELAGHSSTVYGVVLTSDGKQLISTSVDNTYRIWDVSSQTLIKSVRGRGRAMMDLALDPTGETMAIGDIDGTVRLRNIESGEEIRVLRGHERKVWGGDFSPDGTQLVAGSEDGTVRLWDVDNGDSRILGRHEGRVYCADFHPDGKRVGSPSADGTARIWNIESGDSIAIRGHSGEVNAIRFDQDGDSVATVSDDGTIRLWEVDTGRPIWRAPVLIDEPPQLFTHLGWIELATSSPVNVGGADWRRAIAERARSAAVSPGSSILCIATHDEALELWDRRSDTMAFDERLPGLNHVIGLPGGCVALADETARLFLPGGAKRELATTVSAAASSNNQILLAAGDEVIVFSPTGERRNSYKANTGATALARVGDSLVLGYKDGNLEIVPTIAGVERPSFTFEQVPSSPVVRLTEGPMGTIVAGFANGLWGIWNRGNGALLYDARLHGPVVHLLLQRGKLYAASELGQHSVLDVSMFDRDYCDLMREVWDEVPVIWSDGLPVLGDPPVDHPCRRPDAN